MLPVPFSASGSVQGETDVERQRQREVCMWAVTGVHIDGQVFFWAQCDSEYSCHVLSLDSLTWDSLVFPDLKGLSVSSTFSLDGYVFLVTEPSRDGRAYAYTTDRGMMSFGPPDTESNRCNVSDYCWSDPVTTAVPPYVVHRVSVHIPVGRHVLILIAAVNMAAWADDDHTVLAYDTVSSTYHACRKISVLRGFSVVLSPSPAIFLATEGKRCHILRVVEGEE
ncbi:hypothetical protein KIPB_008833 [Kipferlia bialata]|uniref:Uncharacterized protein n=1 Tax=Kipferlia bialata TaxID=797122 RepID=A0A9K3D0L7_9EUKA|nr:hypothetical protein KIPB_008833 [Kipferlia bialata]|eukprot:g8833.t1